MASAPAGGPEPPASLDAAAAALREEQRAGDSGAMMAAATDLLDVLVETFRQLAPPKNLWTVLGYYDGGHPIVVAVMPGQLKVASRDADTDEAAFARHILAANPKEAIAAVRRQGR